jgi:hypothetical protein
MPRSTTQHNKGIDKPLMSRRGEGGEQTERDETHKEHFLMIVVQFSIL